MSSRAWDHRLGPRIRTTWALPALAALAACSACASKSTAAASIATDVADIAAPPPSPPPRSRFSVPLKYDFGAILRIVERSVPLTIGSMDSVHEVANDSRRHYAYLATRSPFIAFADGDSL